jgi:hypothetical protein
MTDTNIGLSIEPIIKYPSEAEVGKMYLLTIDLRPLDFDEKWPYHDIEEQTIHCLINSAPLFRSSPLGDSCVVIHRFGGSYGPARFRLTASAKEGEGTIRITLVNSKGLPLDVIETPTIHVRQRSHTPTRISVISSAEMKVSDNNAVLIDGETVGANLGTITVDNTARIHGVAVGVNLGTIIYGRPPEEDKRRQLVWYLERVTSRLFRLPLRGLEERLDRGQGVGLPQVYVMLATQSQIEVIRGSISSLSRYLELNVSQILIKTASVDHRC